MKFIVPNFVKGAAAAAQLASEGAGIIPFDLSCL